MNRQHRSISVALCLAALLVAPAAKAQIASRVAAAPDGEVRMTYAARANACGDGKDAVAVGKALNIYSSMESYGSWSGVNCVHGPARVALTVRDHQVVGVRTRIGGSWRAAEGAVTDLGVVPARQAASYFLSLAPAMSGSRRNPLPAAAVADSTDIAPEMLRLARDEKQPLYLRRRALHWVGVTGGAEMVAPLTALARQSDDARSNESDVGPGNGLNSAAVGALGMLPEDAGLNALLDLARHGNPAARKAAVFWLGQSEEPRARALVRTVVEDANETEQVRGSAIFALGQGDNSTASDAAFLRGVFNRLPSDRLKERVLMAMAQSEEPEHARWLLAEARDEQQPVEVRKKALFWAGQGNASVADIVALYGTLTERRLREQAIFVLSQRKEEPATDALVRIARSDEDREMRKKAFFWLAQKNDPRVSKMIADIVLR
jgi:hypothetical protein